MAIKSRKLFPAGTGANQTTDCSDFCYSGCPYDCYSFPDFYYPPPPPPLSSADHSHLQKHALSPLIIVLIALFVGLVILFSYYILIVRSCAGWCSSSRNTGRGPEQSDGAEEEFLDENRVDHPIWFITTVGLQQSVINSITVCKFKKGEGLIEGTECSVCLSEFQEDEMLRLLPKCSHAFHIPCVDTWLRSHTNCPLCRALIVTDIVSSNAVRPPNMASGNQDEGNLGSNEGTQMENAEMNVELVGENQVLPGGSCENGEEIEDQREGIHQVGEVIPKDGIESVDTNGNSETEQNEVLGNPEQPVANSEPIDSSAAACEGQAGRPVKKLHNMQTSD